MSGSGGNGIDIGGNSGSVTFQGATNVTLGATANRAGINFAGTNADVTFGTTNVTLGAGANQTGIDFSGSSTTAGFGVTTITGTGDLTSRGIDLSSTTGNKTITFQQGSKIDNAGVGVELASDGTTATSANANFTFGDGNSTDGLESFIIAASGGYTVNTVGLDPTKGSYDFDDVFFTGSANLPSAVGGITMVSQNGGVIAAGTFGLSQSVTTISVAAADAIAGSTTFAFVGTVDLSGTPFTLDSGQSITGFGNGNAVTTTGTIQPANVTGNLGATGGNITGNEAVVSGTGDFMHLLGNNAVRNTAFNFSGAAGSVFLVDQSAGGFSNAGGITIEGVTISNVAAGRTAIKVAGLDTNLSVINNNINVAGTLLDVNGGTGTISVSRGFLPNAGPAGTLTGGGINIANRTGGSVTFTDQVTLTGGNGVSLTNNAGSTVSFANAIISSTGATAFSAVGGGTVNVTTGTVNATNAQAVALDGIAANINFASTSATFSSGNGVDLQNLSGTLSLGTGTLTNTGSGTSFNVGSATNASGGNSVISYGGTIASNGTGAAVSIQEMTGGSVSLSGNLTDTNAAAGGNIVIAGNNSATITFSGSTKQISSGATDGVNIGWPGGVVSGVPNPNPNSAINFTNGGLDITTTTGGMGFVAFGGFGPGSLTVTGSGNKINSGGDGLLVAGTNVGASGITFDSISAVSTVNAAGVLLSGLALTGDINIGGLRDTGYTGALLAGLTGAGVVNFTGTTDLDVSYRGFDIGGPVVGTINIANVAGSTLTIDGGEGGIVTSGLQDGIINVGGNGGLASIGATTSTSGSAISLSGGNDLINATLNYKGSIKVASGSVLGAGSDWTHLNLSGSVTSTTSSMAFGFFGANGVYDISSTIAHTGGIGIAFNGTSQGTATFSGTSKTFSTGATDAIVRSAGIGTLAFTNGGLGITTGSGYGINASTTGAGRFSVSGANNTITTTTGSALRLDGVTLGADGVNFSSISVNGAGTGILLNNVSGGAVNLGTVNLQGITGTGVDVTGTLGSTVNFASLSIGLGAASAIGLDLNGAALGTSNITAGDFDVDGGSFAGTIGIDMAGTTGTGTIQLGDTVNNNPAGQISTISNVGYGVQFSSATNARLVFGDGVGPAESTISTTGGQVIHATDSLPTNGDYNFDDVNFSGDISNLSAISVYYVTAGGTGDGSLANPGSYAGAQTSTANVVVLIDKIGGSTQETIDLGGTSFQLDDGQVLLAFKSGDAAVDVSQLGVDASGGASAAFHFTTIQNTSIIAAPAGIDTLRPILQSNNATSVINLATSGTGTVTGGIQNLIVSNLGSGAGVAVNATAASSFFLRNNTITAGGNALDFSTTGAPANTLLLSIDGNTLQSTGSGLAASFTGQNINTTDNSIAIRSFAGNKVTGGAGSGGIVFNNVRFDSDGAGGTVNAGTLAVGNPGARVQGNGLSFTNTSGTFNMGTLNLANTGGTGVIANTKTTNFTLNNSGGVVNTQIGAAFDLDPLTVNMTFASVSSGSDASGIIFDGVAGTFTVTGATNISSTTGFAIDAINTNTGTFNFNAVTVNNSLTAGGGIRVATGTLNVTGLANIDTTTGVGLSQSGGTTSFANGLTIDTTSGTGIVGTGGTMGITATAAAQTVNSTGGQAINLANVAASIALDSTKSGGGTNNVGLTNVSGSINLGTGTLTNNGAGAAFNVGSGADLSGGNATISYAGAIVSNGSGAAVSILELTGGSVTLSGNLTDTNAAGGGQIVVANINNGTAATVTFSGATKQIQSGATDGVNLVGNVNGTIDFSNGGLAINTTSGIGFHAQSGGTISVAGTTNTITSAGNALSLDAVTVGSGINFNSVSTSSGAVTGIGLTNVASAGGAINLGTVNLQGISSRGVDVTGTLGAGLNFNSLSIGLTSTTAVAFDLNGAQINAAITANDFDVINSIGAGTSIGVDLRGATGGQIVRLGDAAAGGASSSISGVNTGVFLDSATNLAFTYGDGESATDQASTIGASVGIDASSAPVAGTYNFQDVNFAASPGLGFGVGKIYFVGASATGDGTGRDQNNLATLTTAEAASVTSDVLVLVNDGGTITAAGSGADNTLVLSTGEQVRGFGNGNINLAMSVPSTIQLANNSISIVDATPNGAATLTTNAGSNAITLGASGNFIDGFILDGSPAGAARGIKDNGGGASGTIISHMTIQNFATAGVEITPSTSTGIDNVTFAGNASDVIVNALNTSISNVFSTGATGIAFDIRNTTGTTTLANLNVTTAATGTGIVFGGGTGPQGTIIGTNVDVIGGAGGGITVTGGNAAIGFDAASFVGVPDTSSGTAVTITGRSGGSFAFAGSVVANGTASGISVSGATAANTVSFTGAVGLGTVATLTGTAVSIDNNGTASTVSFSNLGIVTSGTTGFSAANGGTVNVSTGTVNSSGAQAINLNGVATTTGINFTSTTSTGGANNVSLTNVTGAGTVSLGTGSLTGATGVAFLLNGGAATVSYGGTLTKTTAGKIVDISGVTGGGDNGIFVHGNAGGAFTFSGGTKTLTTDANTAVDLTNNGGATIDFTGGGLAINTTTGTGFSATGAGTLSVTGGGNSITTTSGVAMNLQGITVGGSHVSFASTTKGAGGTSAVVMNGVVGAGSVNLGTGSLVGGSAATILIGDGAGGANTGGTAGLIYAGGITSGASQAVNIQDRTAGAQNINLSGNISHISASQTGIILADNAAGTITFSGGTKLISSGSATAVAIANTGASAVFSSGGLSISTTAGNGLDISGTGTVTISGGLNTVNTQTGTAFANLGGSATVTSDAALTTGNAGRVVDIQNRTANNVTLSGNVSNTGPGALGLRVQNVTGGTVTFSGAKMLTTTTNTAVNLNSNTNGTINFTGGGLAINTTTGIGFSATGGGTVTVQGIVNTITSTSATALNVANTTIGGSGLTFQSISANGAVNGIVLNNTGAGGLTVTGVGTNAGSGGTIQNTTGRGASFISASNITLKNMNFTNAGTDDLDADNSGLSTGDNLATNAAIHLQNVSTATLDRIAISGSAEQGINGNTVSNFTLSNSSISNAGNSADEDGIHFYNMSGTSAITNTTITGSGDDNFNLQTQSGTLALTISGGSSTGAVLGSGYLFGIRGTSNATINLSSANSSNNFSGGIVADAFDNSTMNLNVINSTSSSNNDQLSVSAGDNSDVSLVATGNTLSSTATGDFVVVSLLGSAFDNGFTFDARIENNNITVANGLTADGISVFNAGGGAMRVGIKNNTIDYAGTQRAILVQTGQDGAGSILAQITGNAIDIKLDGTGNAVAGILVQSGITSPTGDGSSIDLNIGGAGALANTFTHSLGGTMAGGDIRVRQRNNGTINLSGYAGGATDLAAAIAYLNGRNTVVSASTATADSTGFTGLATPPFP
ncbi:hypothetical protein [Mesorhizobium sp.]|uniref:hypothetical protein n=1 Tax=Mesorhizobium sp. TaxID=1871066 RepID=UPI0025BA1F13|nr:hypothetical protein [Mesorhizobium sp.]